MLTRSLIVFGYVLLLSGCKDEVWTQRNLDHCTWKGGDGYCADRSPDTPYCVAGEGECLVGGRYGCVAEVTLECHAPCGEPGDLSCVGGESSTGTSSGSESGTESSNGSSDSSTTTGPMPCVSDEECIEAMAPFCGVSGECGTCDGTADGDAACSGVDPGLPLCVGDACVACTPENPVVCDEQLLLCDGTINACVSCTEHTQCGSGACELAVGTCFPPDVVVTVDGDPGAMPPPDYTSIDAAVSAAGAGEHRVVVVHEYGMDGETPYTDTVTVNGDKRIALLAAPGEHPVILGTGAGNPGVLVEGAGTILYMDGLRVALSPGVGLRVNDALAWVDRSHIVQNTGGGVLAENGAELVLRNCFVGGSVNNVAALSVSNATATLTYVTAGAGFGAATALTCDVAATVDARNSLFVSEDAGGDEVQCPGVTIEHSAAELDLGGTNVGLGDMATTWFMGYGTGDFHLVPAHPAAIDTAAQWSTGDPLTDIDGDPRPAIDATADYAGADVPQ